MTIVKNQVFHDDAIAPDTRALNAQILEKLGALPDQWAFPAATIRRLRAEGRGPFPPMPLCERAVGIEIEGPRGPIGLRIIPARACRGVYLHIHGGGWTFGTTDMHDPLLERLAERCGLTVVSVDYRLAPEFPYPAGPDDCETAALWLVRESEKRFGSSWLAIGGESAGAHLAALTLLRLRDRHGMMPFSAANLTCGCFDLSLTPSVRRWGTRKLVLNTRDIRNFVRNFVPEGLDPAHPDISPLHADLTGLPPALFSIGTLDPLLDDSLFMASRWQAAGNAAELAVYAGGCHVFQLFPFPLAQESLSRIEDFLNGQRG